MTSALNPLSIEELFDLEMPQVEWVVEDMAPAGSLTLHVGREKGGKSLQQIDLVCSVALGETFMDRAVRQGTAIYLPAEDNLREVRSRLAARLDGRREGPHNVVPVNGYTADRLRLDDPDSLQALHDLIVRLDARIVGIDPLRETHNLAENDADAMGPMLRPLRQIAHATNTAIVLAHHMSRAGYSRGSTAIKASVDQEWAFTRADDDGDNPDATAPVGRLVIEGRFGPRQVLNVRLSDGLRWNPTSLILVEPTAALRDRIIAHLTNVDAWLDVDDLVKVLGGAKKTVQNAMSQIMRERPCPVATSGTGKSNDPRRYHALTREPWAGDAIPPTEQNGSRDSFTYTHGNREPIPPSTPNGSGNDGNRSGNASQTVPDAPTHRGAGTRNRFDEDTDEDEGDMTWTA